MKNIHTVKVGDAVYRYLRRKGLPSVRLYTEPGTPEFLDEVACASALHEMRNWSPEARWASFVDEVGRSLGPEVERSARTRALRAGRPYTLPTGWVEQEFFRTGGLCAVSRLPLYKDRPKRAPFAPSIDRVSSLHGYVPSNTRLVCYMVNCGMNMFTDNEFFDMCEAVQRVRSVKRHPLAVK